MELTNQNVSDTPSINESLEEVDEETRSPPSETSSQEWDRISDPGLQTPA